MNPSPPIDPQPEAGTGGSPRCGPRRRRHRRTAVLVAVVAVLGLLVPAAGAEPPSSDSATAAAYGARWAAAQVNDQGFVPNLDDSPNYAATVETAIGLALAGVDQGTFDRIMSWLQANAATAMLEPGGQPGAGQIGYLLMLAEAAGVDPHAFGGVDLVTTLGSTLGSFTPGLYGAADPTYDGVFRQSLALLGLVAIGVTPPAPAVAWLVGQQCGAVPAAAAGGWSAFRADPAVPCAAPDPATFVGPDTNSTALAVQALARLGESGAVSSGLSFLHAAMASGGGFALIPGGDADPNSTAVVVQAIVAGGEDPSGGRWLSGGASPVTALLSWQLGCTADAEAIGAFTSPYSEGGPDAFATRQAVWGASLRAFPLPARALAATAPIPCLAPVVPADPGPPTVVPGPSATGSVVPASYGPVVVPAFTG